MMNNQVLEYCARAVIQHLNGDMKQFTKYKNKAIEIYEKQIFEESCMCSISELVPEGTKRKLYEMVS